MNFLNQLMFWGLLAVAIPVIIHLFNFRRHKKIFFTNVKFIQELKQQTQRQSRLRHLLVLIARIVAIACLVFAFAQPYIPVSESMVAPQAVNVISIYVDNSFSMEAEATNGELISVAKEKAREIAGAYRSSDQFQLITNDFEGSHDRLVSQEEFLEYLEHIHLSPSVRPVSHVIRRQDQLLQTAASGKKIRFLISDFQKSTSDFDHVKNDSLVTSFLVPVSPENIVNLYIDSCWFESPVHQLGQAVRLKARIRNESGNDYEKIPLKLLVNGSQKALASFDIQAGAATVVELPFTNHDAGIQSGVLEITDYPVTFDDSFFLVYEVQSAIPVLNIFGMNEPVFLNALLGQDPAFEYTASSYKSINYDKIPSYSLIILDGLQEISSGLAQALSEFLKNGGSLLVIPGTEIDLSSYRDFLGGLGAGSYRESIVASTSVSDLDLQNPVFMDVFEDEKPGVSNSDSRPDLPRVTKYYPFSAPAGGYKISLMKLMNNDDFLTAEQVNAGSLYLLAVPLDDEFTNLQRHALFVPMVYRMAYLSGASSPLYYSIGSQEVINIKNTKIQGDDVLKLVNLQENMEFIPGQRSLGSTLNLLLYDQIKSAGHYTVRSNDKVFEGLAFNYNRRESSVSFYSADDLSEILSDNGLDGFSVLKDKNRPLRESLEELNQGRRLWKLFIILALFFLAAEIFLIRVWAIK